MGPAPRQTGSMMKRLTLPATRRAVLAGAASASALAIGACAPRGGGNGFLRVAIDTEPDSLDPLKGQFAASALLYKQLHAPLTEYSPSGGLAPGLAQSWRSDDGRSWRFQLAEGLQWSDGTPLTAEDVVWTAQRAVDPRTGFANLGDFFAVTGARDALAGRAPASAIGVTAPDPRTIVFELETPIGAFPVLMREFYPLPRHAIDAHGDRWVRAENWVSSGPYILREANALTYLLAKNPRFQAAGSVSIENIRVDVVEDEATRARLFRSGDLDLADRPPPEQIGFLRREIGDRLHGFDAPILTYLKLNHRREALSDVRVRRALSLAVDRQFLADNFFLAARPRPPFTSFPPKCWRALTGLYRRQTATRHAPCWPRPDTGRTIHYRWSCASRRAAGSVSPSPLPMTCAARGWKSRSSPPTRSM